MHLSSSAHAWGMQRWGRVEPTGCTKAGLYCIAGVSRDVFLGSIKWGVLPWLHSLCFVVSRNGIHRRFSPSPLGSRSWEESFFHRRPQSSPFSWARQQFWGAHAQHSCASCSKKLLRIGPDLRSASLRWRLVAQFYWTFNRHAWECVYAHSTDHSRLVCRWVLMILMIMMSWILLAVIETSQGWLIGGGCYSISSYLWRLYRKL